MQNFEFEMPLSFDDLQGGNFHFPSLIADEALNENPDEDSVVGSDSVSNLQSTISSGPKKSRSAVWQIFRKSDDGSQAFCNHCKSKFKVTGSATTNLRNHAKKDHHAAWLAANNMQPLEATSAQQIGIQQAFAQCPALITADGVKERILRLVVKRDLPFELVESVEFRDLVAYLNPKARTISADTLKRSILLKHEVERQKLAEKLKNNKSKISFTTDIWTSPATQSYMAVTAHFIDEDWKLMSTLLDFDHLEGPHTGQNIANMYHEIVDVKFKLSDKVLAITCDNANNNNEFIRRYSEMNKQFSPDNRVRCYAHILNIAVQSCMKIKENSISRLRSGLVSIKRSTTRMERLKELCETVNPKVRYLKPILDVSTRWNSTADMLERAIELRSPLEIAFGELQRSSKEHKDLELRNADWAIFHEYLSFLKPYRELTVLVCGDKFPSQSLVIPYHKLLIANVVKTMNSPTSTDLLKKCAQAAKSKLDEYEPPSGLSSIIASVLDPRLKTETSLQSLLNDKIQSVEHLMRLVNDEYIRVYAPKSASNHVNDDPVEDSLSGMLFKRRKVDVSDEFIAYRRQPPVDGKADPVDWWRQHQEEFPNLSRMARDYLSIAASSASSERHFSKARYLITDSRSCLATESVRACQCLKSWINSAPSHSS